jgi:hypothetical protein
MVTPEMRRIIYVIRSALELRSTQATSHVIHLDEFIADFELAFPSTVDPNAIDYMIHSLIAETEQRELMEKYQKESSAAAPFIVRNSNYSNDVPKTDFQPPTKEQLSDQQKLFPPYQLR